MDWCLRLCVAAGVTLIASHFLGISLSSQVGILIRASLQLRFASSCLKEEGWIHQKIAQSSCK